MKPPLHPMQFLRHWMNPPIDTSKSDFKDDADFWDQPHTTETNSGVTRNVVFVPGHKKWDSHASS